jgi:hypothetical protein
MLAVKHYWLLFNQKPAKQVFPVENQIKMIRKLTIMSLALLLSIGLQAQFNLKGELKKMKEKITGGEALTQEEIGNGLKEALNVGIKEGVDVLSAEDGYYQSVYKVLLPEEAQKVASRLRAVPGFSNFEEDLILKLNRAAEDAAKKATPIFVEAIKQMTFKDALNILMGEKDAATRYLESSTYNPLYDEFKPVIIESLDKFNAREFWKKGATAYNKIPLTKEVTTELDDYVTTQALVGLFSMVEKKEKDIRGNKSSRTSELLQKVFAKQDN